MTYPRASTLLSAEGAAVPIVASDAMITMMMVVLNCIAIVLSSLMGIYNERLELEAGRCVWRGERARSMLRIGFFI